MIEAIRSHDVEEADRLAHNHTLQFHERFLNFMRARYDDDFCFEWPTSAA